MVRFVPQKLVWTQESRYIGCMGNTADDRLTTIATQRFLQKAGLGPFVPAERWREEAAEMAEAERMSLADALMIVSGASRPPYATPRKPKPPLTGCP